MSSMTAESGRRSTALSTFSITVDQTDVGFCHVATDRAMLLSPNPCLRATNSVSKGAIGSMAEPGPTATADSSLVDCRQQRRTNSSGSKGGRGPCIALLHSFFRGWDSV